MRQEKINLCRSRRKWGNMSITTAETQSRKWLVTINNPIQKDMTHKAIKEVLNNMSSLVYWCMADEENNTYHTHLYFVLKSAIRRSTLDNKFKGAHFDKPIGTSLENRNYVFKDGEKFNKNIETGKYDYTDKKGKKHIGIHYDKTNEEYGDMPEEKPGRRTDIIELYELIKDGCSNYEIMEYNPKYMLHMDKVDKARQTIREEEYKDTWRNLQVTYIYGITGAGKTRGVMEKYGYSNVYRVTDYEHPFDSYKGQDVVIFEEFRSSLKIDDMLKYLDGYPVELPARYMNRIACFTKVYIISNIDIREQYPNIQEYQKETWNAFLRRIHNVKIYDGHAVAEMPLQTYLDCANPFTITTPFDTEEK